MNHFITGVAFVAGTMIRTPDGAVAVETLNRGDLVITADGRAKPVCWFGRRIVSTQSANPRRALPIRIKAGALGDNVPGRDLLLAPDHAVLVEGALIHADALVNDRSIVRETAMPENFTCYHVELTDHSLVLAENTPAESSARKVGRLAFDNWRLAFDNWRLAFENWRPAFEHWHEYEALYPKGKSGAALPYPRAKGRRQVPVHVRVQLAERAAMIGAAPYGVMFA